MIVRYGDERDEENQRGMILLFIMSKWGPDATLNLEELVELRNEIDRFLFLDARRAP